MHKKLSTQSGQILVIFLLIMIVGLTIGLLLLSRTTTDISLTTRVTDASRAFNAAEAGVEEAIRQAVVSIPGATPTPVPLASGVTYSLITGTLGNSTGIYPETPGADITVGEPFTVWLVPHDADGNLVTTTREYTGSQIDICFTNNIPLPAMGVTVYFKDTADGNKIKSSYTVYDPATPKRISSYNGVDSPLAPCPASYNRRARVDFSNSAIFGQTLDVGSVVLIALRIRPLYATSKIAVIPISDNLPQQGNAIESTGNAGETARRIEVDQPFTVPAPFLDHAIYSTGANSGDELIK